MKLLYKTVFVFTFGLVVAHALSVVMGWETSFIIPTFATLLYLADQVDLLHDEPGGGDGDCDCDCVGCVQ